MGWFWIWQDIKRNLNPPHFSTREKSMLFFFHAYKGCDITSAMFGIDKGIA
jgi:hypothetical protein